MWAEKRPYRERADGGRGELGQVEVLGLDLLANGEGALALELIGGDSSNTLADGVIRGTLEFATLRNRDFVGLKGGGDGGILRAREGGSNGGDLGGLLEGEREPILLLSSELLLGSESDGGVEERRGGGNDDTVGTKAINCLLAELDRGGEVSLPDVTTRNNSEGKNDAGGLDSHEDLVKLTGSTVKVDVETSNRELGNKGQVGIEAREVSGQQDLRGDGGEGFVSSGVLLLESSSSVEDEDGLVNLHPLGTGGLEVGQESLVDREEFGEEGDGLESGRGLFGSLAQDQERDGAQDDRAGGNTSSLGLLELLDSLVEVQFELGLFRDLRNDKVVVRVEPRIED
jgi:hypothetical protein